MTKTDQRLLYSKIVLICVLTSLLCSFLIIYIFYTYTSDTVFYGNESCFEGSVFQFCYFGNKDVWSDSSYLQTINGFYSSIITVLIGIIAIVATVGAYTIKSSLRAQTEQELPQVVEAYFRQIDGHGKISEAVRSEMDSAKAEFKSILNNLSIPEQGALIAMINGMERRLEALEVGIIEEIEEQ